MEVKKQSLRATAPVPGTLSSSDHSMSRAVVVHSSQLRNTRGVGSFPKLHCAAHVAGRSQGLDTCHVPTALPTSETWVARLQNAVLGVKRPWDSSLSSATKNLLNIGEVTRA